MNCKLSTAWHQNSEPDSLLCRVSIVTANKLTSRNKSINRNRAADVKFSKKF